MMKTVLTIAALLAGAAITVFTALVLNELGHFVDEMKGSD